MGTTLVAASIQGNTLYVANVGDSRLYRIERSGIHQITRDHSYVEAMVSLGQMSRGSREYETKKNILPAQSGSVGMWSRISLRFREPGRLHTAVFGAG